MLPVPVDEEGKYAGINSIREEIVLARAYVQEAFQNRPSDKPLAVAFLITKMDVLDEDLESSEGKRTVDAIAGLLEQQFAFLVKSPCVSSAVSLPVSALGFDNAVLMPNQDGKSRSRLFYTLKNDNLEPYNVDKALLWSVASAVYQTNMQVGEHVKQALAKNLQKMNGLLYPIKQG